MSVVVSLGLFWITYDFPFSTKLKDLDEGIPDEWKSESSVTVNCDFGARIERVCGPPFFSIIT